VNPLPAQQRQPPPAATTATPPPTPKTATQKKFPSIKQSSIFKKISRNREENII